MLYRYRYALIVTSLIFASLFACTLILQNAKTVQTATLEQMLSKQEREELYQVRRLFRSDSEPVLVSIRGRQSNRKRAYDLKAALGLLPGVVAVHPVANRVPTLAADETRDTRLWVLLLDSTPRTLKVDQRLTRALAQTISETIDAEESFAVVGNPQLRSASWEIAEQDINALLPILLLITLVVTYLFFRSWQALGLATLLTSTTTFCCLVLLQFSQQHVPDLLVLIVPVIWSIATLDAFHLVVRIRLEQRRGSANPARDAARAIFIPCLATTLTTAACLASLALTDTSPLIANFGLWSALSALIAFALTFSLGVGLMRYSDKLSAGPLWPSAIAYHVVRGSEHHAKTVIFVWFLLSVLAAMAVPRIGVDSRYPDLFVSEHQFAKDLAELSDLLGSDLNPIDLVIRPNDAHGAQPERMASATLLASNYLRTIDETRRVLPMDGLVQQVKDGWARWSDATSTTRNKAEEIATGVQSSDPNLSHPAAMWISEDRGAMRIQWYLAPTTFDRKEEILAWLQNFDDDVLTSHTISAAGPGYYTHLVEQRGVHSLWLSSAASILFIAIALLILTRRLIRAAGALLVAAVPALLVMGAMGWMGIPWSMALLPLPVLILGLVNDDTIHMLWRGNLRMRSLKLHSRGATVENNPTLLRHWRRNALEVAPALMATTLLLATSLATLLLSGIRSNQDLGFLIPIGLLLALLCNLSLLPALSSLRRR